MVECTGLENRRAWKRTVGSNPTSSATIPAQVPFATGEGGKAGTVRTNFRFDRETCHEGPAARPGSLRTRDAGESIKGADCALRIFARAPVAGCAQANSIGGPFPRRRCQAPGFPGGFRCFPIVYDFSPAISSMIGMRCFIQPDPERAPTNGSRRSWRCRQSDQSMARSFRPSRSSVCPA